MPRRSRPHYRPGLGWILGVAFGDTLTRPVRLAQGFTCVRCCGSPRASSPHGLTAPALASPDGSHCVQLPPARGCYQLAPQRTFPSNPVVRWRPVLERAEAAQQGELHLAEAGEIPAKRGAGVADTVVSSQINFLVFD